MNKTKMTNKTGKKRCSLVWIFTVSRRFASVDRKGRSAATSILATLAIALGVMSLIAVLSVMNGFQMSFIDSIMEISSYHIRVNFKNGSEDSKNHENPFEEEASFISFCEDFSEINAVSPFYETQGLIVGSRSNESASIIRGINEQSSRADTGFMKELKIIYGKFDLSSDKNIVIGSGLASLLGVRIGGRVNLLAMGGGSDVALFSQNRQFTVTGIFECGYSDINSSYAFVSIEAAQKYFGKDAVLNYGLKIKHPNNDAKIAAHIAREFPHADIQSWREYNRSFFGALKTEKNILRLLVFLIFIVVAVNIYNGMRRLVFERASEIAILSAIGGTPTEIKSIFILRGFSTGFVGAVLGVALGIIVSMNMKSIFLALSRIMFFFEYAFTCIFSPANASFVTENPMYSIYASIPARIFPSEVMIIALFGILSPLIASWLASKNILKMNVAEVLHDE